MTNEEKLEKKIELLEELVVDIIDALDWITTVPDNIRTDCKTAFDNYMKQQKKLEL